MTVLVVLAAVFATGMIVMIFDSFKLFQIFKKSPVRVNAADISETKVFFRRGKK